ncbi:amidase [Alteromonas flava]|uniref:amidase n=1 Tax=Alteromonas flava TaxID=2048003 RepID=UPI000C288AFD|nr:amidase [Alteromonas flava]
MKYLLVLSFALSLSSCVNTPQTKGSYTQWWQLNAVELVTQLEQGNVTSVELVQHYNQRIERFDWDGPRIQSVLTLNPNALKEAQRLDELRSQGQVLSPLHGIPILVKDNIDTKNLPTTAGSLALINNDTQRDAPIIQRLKSAGLIILGKTNLSEWANFRSEDSISGWSGVGGQTRNPHDLSRSPCGSSSGSGAAVAAGFAPVAIGTETNGSIICPASMNGIVGYKPTVGLLPRTHIVPISPSQDTAGPMTKSVHDAALLAAIMAGPDSQDELSKGTETLVEELQQALSPSLKGVRIGVMRTEQGRNAVIIDVFNSALTALSAAGAELVDITEYNPPEDFWDASYQVLLSEFEPSLNAYLSSTPNQEQPRSLADLIEFNASSERELMLFDQSIFEKASKAPSLESQDYRNAVNLVQQATRAEGIDQLLADYNVSLLVAPSNNPAFMIDGIYGDHGPWGWLGFGWAAAIAGYPHVSIPMGVYKHLPLGISIISGQWEDVAVLNAAAALQQQIRVELMPAAISSDGWQKEQSVWLPIETKPR